MESSQRDDSNEWSRHRVRLRNTKVKILNTPIFVGLPVDLGTAGMKTGFPKAEFYDVYVSICEPTCPIDQERLNGLRWSPGVLEACTIVRISFLLQVL